MISQLRIYTINKGMMESWIKLFHEHLQPNHEKYGIPIEASWINEDRTEFIWVRNFGSIEEMQAKEAEYYSSPERIMLGDRPQTHIAKIEIRIVEPTNPRSS